MQLIQNKEGLLIWGRCGWVLWGFGGAHKVPYITKGGLNRKYLGTTALTKYKVIKLGCLQCRH